jgi:hypothetical protein
MLGALCAGTPMPNEIRRVISRMIVSTPPRSSRSATVRSVRAALFPQLCTTIPSARNDSAGSRVTTSQTGDSPPGSVASTGTQTPSPSTFGANAAACPRRRGRGS